MCQGMCRRDMAWGLKESQDAWDPVKEGKSEQAKG